MRPEDLRGRRRGSVGWGIGVMGGSSFLKVPGFHRLHRVAWLRIQACLSLRFSRLPALDSLLRRYAVLSVLQRTQCVGCVAGRLAEFQRVIGFLGIACLLDQGLHAFVLIGSVT